MKVVHIIKGDAAGAYRAAKRLNSALNNNGIESLILTKNDIKYNLSQIPWFTFAKLDEIVLKHTINDEYYFGRDAFGCDPKRLKELADADIVHLHWVDKGLVGRNTLKILADLKKPIVWTLHDMRPFTGGCHYTGECDNYLSGCRGCPAFSGEIGKQIVRNSVKNNKKIYSQLNLTVVGCSSWIAECARRSFSMKDINIANIPNCIETSVFSPMEKCKAREQLGLTEFGEKKVILFGAMSSTSDKRKGYALLKEALKRLPKEQYVCVVFGGMEKEEIAGISVHSLGSIHEEKTLVAAYSSADVFVAPSIQENLANTVIESMACGTPVVAFGVGGMPDMIQHKENGYLAKAFDTKDLADGISYCCENTKLQINARKKVEESYTYELIAKRYIDTYKKLME